MKSFATALAFACVLGCSPSLPSGPVDVAWDAEACAECRMLVGEPHFAAQLQTREGRVLNFDDPGCAMRYEAREKPAVNALYFHDHASERWLRADEVGFVELPMSPMGYRLGAVPKGTAGAMSLAAARTRTRGEPTARGDMP